MDLEIAMTLPFRLPVMASLAALLALQGAPALAQSDTATELFEELPERQSSEQITEKLTRGLAITEGSAPESETEAQTAAAERPSVDLRINFEFDSDRLTPQARAQLDELARALTDPRLATSRVRLDGHTDSRGDAGYNQDLSERRARSAGSYLVERHGIAPSRIQTRGMGERQPLTPSAPEAAVNRRVVVTNLGS